ACLPILLSGHRINRFEGGLLTSTFVIYTVLLFVGWPFPADRGTATPEGEATSTLRNEHWDEHRIDHATPDSHRA
ncbi:MAG: hypothetical protein P8J59_07500, partial [Phycisphaerales bacterium]|nr:hypothetical protein [Phycisphaerales bacterium]